MAFHGGRGAPRGQGFGRGRSRAGGSRGRGRGGMRRGRGKPIFDSARVAEQKKDNSDEEESPTEGESEEEEALSQDVSSDDSDAEEPTAIRPYSALLQSLAVDLAPEAKRRKVESTVENSIAETQEEDALMPPTGDDIDKVDEAEEGPETAVEGLLEDDDHDMEDVLDPFEVHFANPDDNILSRRLDALQESKWTTQKHFVPKIGKAIFSAPDDISAKDVAMPGALSGPASLKLKQKLANSVIKQTTAFDALEQAIAPCLFNYHDLLFCERTPANSGRLRRLTCLHAINHVFKTRDRVIKNNARLAKEADNDDLELRDQGFTRPKILMLLPTRQSCVKMINMVTLLCEPEQQENRKRFEESYIDQEEKFSADKAEDFRELFAGNDDDMFRLGIKFTRKTIKYFSQFYNSDIIFASPLGLRMALGTEESKKVNSDFLSSIEIVIVDQADALLMQNWEHVEFIFEHLNLQPKEAHGCDFSRVRRWYLDNNARYFRQTIALSAFNTPELNTLFYNKSQNWAGKIKITAAYAGALQEIGVKVKQTFSRLEAPSFFTDPDTRFTYFATAIIPTLIRHKSDNTGTLIFIPSYLDFVRLRNYFSTSADTSSVSFGSISEYTPARDVARARSHFLSGRHSVLLYTERAHHFRRYQLKGVRKVIMYGLPDNPIFYKEIVGGYLSRSIQEGILEPENGNVRVIFSKWDILKLERVAGTERVGRMINEKGDIFDFV